MDKTGVTNEDLGVNNINNVSQTPEQIRAIIDDALEANPSLTEEQVADVVNTAISNLPAGISTADVTNAVNTAIANIPAGLSTSDVSQIVNDALAANPSLTPEQVAEIVNDAVKTIPAGVSKAEATSLVGTAITNATKDLATAKSVDDLKGDLTKAIDDAGKNNADAFDAIDKVIADLKAAGLTEQQVQDVVDLSVGGATKTLQDAIDAAVTGNTKALGDLQDQVAKDIGASETKVADAISDAEKRLSDAVQAAQDLGLKGDEALQAGLDTVAADLVKSKEELLAQLGKTEENLKTQFATDIGTVKKSVTDLEKTLVDTIAANEKAGLTRDEATQKALDDVATKMGTDKADVLKQLGTTEADLTKKVTDLEDALGKKIEGTEKALADKLDEQGKTFMKALTDQGIDQQTALELAIAAQTKLVTEGQNATNLRIDELVKQGMTYQEATQKAITEMSTGFTTKLSEAEKARQADRDTAEAARQADITAATAQRVADQKAASDAAAAAETARQTEIANQKAREAANLKKIQTGQLRGQMQSGLQGLIGGLQQQATQMAAPAQVETVKATPGFDFDSPLNVGFFSGYESQKTPPKDKQSLKIATGGYLDDLLEAIR
jgi:hypothetical protein